MEHLPFNSTPENEKYNHMPMEIPVERNYEDCYKGVPQALHLPVIGSSGHIFGPNQLTSDHLLMIEIDLLNRILVLYPHFYCRVCKALL